MRLPTSSGQAYFLYQATPTWLDYKPGYYSMTLSLSNQGNLLSETMEYHDVFDVYYHQSDDGSIMYHSACVLALTPTDPLPPILTQTDVNLFKRDAIQTVLESVMAQQTDPVDLIFATHVFSSPAWLQHHWLQHNCDLEAANKDILTRIFQL